MHSFSDVIQYDKNHHFYVRSLCKNFYENINQIIILKFNNYKIKELMYCKERMNKKTDSIIDSINEHKIDIVKNEKIIIIMIDYLIDIYNTIIKENIRMAVELFNNTFSMFDIWKKIFMKITIPQEIIYRLFSDTYTNKIYFNKYIPRNNSNYCKESKQLEGFLKLNSDKDYKTIRTELLKKYSYNLYYIRDLFNRINEIGNRLILNKKPRIRYIALTKEYLFIEHKLFMINRRKTNNILCTILNKQDINVEIYMLILTIALLNENSHKFNSKILIIKKNIKLLKIEKHHEDFITYNMNLLKSNLPIMINENHVNDSISFLFQYLKSVKDEHKTNTLILLTTKKNCFSLFRIINQINDNNAVLIDKFIIWIIDDKSESGIYKYISLNNKKKELNVLCGIDIEKIRFILVDH